MSFYGKYVERTLDQLCDHIQLASKVKSDIDIVYNYLLTYEYIPPDKTDEIIGFVNLFNLNVFDFITSLLQSSSSDPHKKIGYNQLKIRESVIGNTSNLLSKVTNKDILKNIQYIRRIEDKFQGSYHYFQSLLHLFHNSHKTYPILNRYYYDFIYKYDLKQPYEYTFRFNIFNELDDVYRNKSAILFVILYSVLRDSVRGHGIRNDFQSYFDSIMPSFRNQLITEFNTFIDTNLNNFASDFYKYVINNNIFIYHESDHFENHVIQVFKEFINTACKSCFNDIVSTFFFNSSFLADNIEDLWTSEIAYKCLKNDVYHRLNIQYFDTDLLYALGLERYMYLQLSVKFRDYYKEDLDQLQYITVQWKNNPLFYINTQLFIHYLWIVYKFNMDDYKSFQFPDIALENDYDIIEYVLDKISISETNAGQLATLLNNYISVTSHISIACNIAVLDMLLNFISNFIESESVTLKIINVLIPNIVGDVHKDFYLQLESYKIVDAIKLFLKAFFYREILNGNLFGNMISNISTDLQSLVTSVNVTSNHIENALERQYLITPNLYGFFERYFFSVRTSEYVNDYIAQYRTGI